MKSKGNMYFKYQMNVHRNFEFYPVVRIFTNKFNFELKIIFYYNNFKDFFSQKQIFLPVAASRVKSQSPRLSELRVRTTVWKGVMNFIMEGCGLLEIRKKTIY